MLRRPRLLLLCGLCITALAPAAPRAQNASLDLLLRNGRIVDGTGSVYNECATPPQRAALTASIGAATGPSGSAIAARAPIRLRG